MSPRSLLRRGEEGRVLLQAGWDRERGSDLMRSGKNAPGTGSSTCKGPEVGTAWWVLGFEKKPVELA